MTPFIYLDRTHNLCRPKIQRLVTPLRLQRRRHLNSLKKRRLDHQKEQKVEYDTLMAKRVAEKKAKAAAIKAAHHKCVASHSHLMKISDP